MDSPMQNAGAPQVIARGVWNVTPGMSASYLVTGSDLALLIDTGPGVTNVKEAVTQITGHPVIVVLTHKHADHTGGARYFDCLYAHPYEIDGLSELGKEIVPVEEGYVFQLGGRSLQVISIPGHTPGSIALFDRDNRMMFTGDMLSDRPVFMMGSDSDYDEYIATMDKLIEMSPLIDAFYGAHGTLANPPDMPAKLKKAAELKKAGKLVPKASDGPMSGSVYLSEDGVGFIVPNRAPTAN
ncbi:MAG: MBL fold metallo-hydrolase [Clostridiales bacterium]|nr:MBL fold metallo-hydrolase [Clostridiales bacterium]